MNAIVDPVDSVRRALDSFVQEEAYLLEVDASERALTHRFAVHIERQFPAWNTDCEYNRDGNAVKKVLMRKLEAESELDEGSAIFPDVIVHRRGTSENLLVIEVKKTHTRRGRDADLEKLAAIKNELGYRHACFVMFTCGNKAPGVEELRWI